MSAISRSVHLRRLALVATAAFVLRAATSVITVRHPIFPSFYYTDAEETERSAAALDQAWRDGQSLVIEGSLSQMVQAHAQAGFYRLFGVRPLAAKLVYALLGGLAVAVFGWLAAAVAEPDAALAAAAAAAVWPSHVFYTSQSFKESPTVLLTYVGLACALALTARGRRDRTAGFLAAGLCAGLIAAGFFRAYILLTAAASLLLGLTWGVAIRRTRPGSAALAIGAVLAALLAYRPVSQALARAFLDRAASTKRLGIDLIPVTYDAETSRVRYTLTSPEGLTQFRRIRMMEDRTRARRSRREIGTQIFPEASFASWLDVAGFMPKGALYALFMPLPGFYPMDGKLGRLLASLENGILLLAALLAAAGAVRGPKTPARLTLLLFFAAMAAGSALLEFDLGSAGRHKLLYLPMLFPFAAEEALRLLRVKAIERNAWGLSAARARIQSVKNGVSP